MLPGKKIDANFAWVVARRRAAWLALPPAIGLFVALVVSARLPDIYQAQTLMRLIPQRVPDSYVRSTVISPISSRLESVSHEVLSFSQIEQLIERFDLYPELRAAQVPVQEIVGRVRSAISIEMVPPPRGQMPDAFHIRFKYVDAALAARVTDHLGALFVEENARDRGSLADATNEFLEAQLAEARQRLEAQEQKLEVFRQRYAGSLPSQLDSNSEALRSTRMQVQALVESMARDRDRKLILERLYRESEAEPVPAVASAAPTPHTPGGTVALAGNSRQQLEAARTNLEALQMRLRPEHPDVIRAKRQIGDLEARVAEEEKVADAQERPAEPIRRSQSVTPEAAARSERLRQMRGEIATLDRQIAFNEGEERRLREVIADYQRRIDTVPSLESEWSVLNRDYETQQAAYKDLLGKSEQSKVAANLERRQIGEQFRVVDPARVPASPISPVRIQINAIGLAAGLVLGLLVVATLELLDSSFRTRADIMDVLALPALATLPMIESATEKRTRQRRAWLMSAAALLAATSGAYVFWAMRLWKFIV